MNQEQYEALVDRLEQESEQRPGWYRTKLGGMALLGYGYIAGILLLLCAALVLLVMMVAKRSATAIAVKLGLILVPLIWAVIRAMTVKLEPPQGRELQRAQAPELFACIDEVRAKAGAPVAHKVLITDEFNAAVVQHPRLGIFGWPRNYLILGLPLMQALDPQEFRSVLAHEFGHLSGAHGKFGAWIYRLRAGWARLTYALEQDDHWGKFLFVPFFKWYAPAFATLSFVQARRQEYEADRMAAVVSGERIAAAALIRVHLQSRFLNASYWRRILQEADNKAEPDAQPFAMLRTAFAEQRLDDGARSTLEAALKRRTGCDDTHPSLSDRLRSLQMPAQLPAPIQTSAAESFLGPLSDQLSGEFDTQWRQSVAAWWQGRHQYATASRTRLAALSSVDGELSVEDAFNRAELTEELGDEAEARAQLETLAARAPDHAPTQFALGRLLLGSDDESGIELLRKAMRLDSGAEQTACALIVDYLQRHGRNEEARAHIDNLHDAGERDHAARKERGEVRINDKLLPHGLAADQLQALSKQLQAFSELKRVYLARKQTVHYQQHALYVLAFERRTRFWKFESSGALQALTHRLSEEVTFPGETIIISVDAENKAFRKRFRAVAGAELQLLS
ncbi:M48 family metalloprotease [Steroidobacter sp.]|uniref:M48 family metalloprotease n=1 Tax=Steroidobacter sp. TaxID=1978227 RepID=UPI001A47BE68|nr:M48 family metalloprotease [Steroidobacter sp.]MBL8266982.1 M48 family metalloprotease [Steroidobacter sp.]